MTEPDARRARLVDVATAAGVTKSVASRVLNDDPSLSIRPETRARVHEAARRLGYRAHAGARALARLEARAVALLIPDLGNPVYTRIIRGAYQRARAVGYVVLLAEDRPEDGEDEVYADLVDSGRVDGLLIASARGNHGLLTSSRLPLIPHVFVNRRVPGSGRNVIMDLDGASALAVRHLHERGHRRIGMVSAPGSLTPARDREQGFVGQMRRLGLQAPVARNSFTEGGGAAATGQLLDAQPDLTAVYCSTLTQAVGALHTIRQRGLRVPDDLSLVAYDDLPLAEYLDPPVTTIAMPLVQLGAAAVDAVVAQLRGEPPRDVMVPDAPRVVERGSVVARAVMAGRARG